MSKFNEYDEKENKVASKMLEVLRLALEINPPEIKDIGKKKTAVFVEWLPHISALDVRIFKSGWTKDNECDEMYTVYTEREEASKELGNIIKRLHDIKRDNAVQLWNDLTLSDKLSFLQIDRDEFATAEGAEVAVNEMFNDLSDEEQIDLFDEIEEV